MQIFELAVEDDLEGDNIFFVEQAKDGEHIRLISNDPKKIAQYNEIVRVEGD